MKIVCPNCEYVNDVESGALHFHCDKCGSTFTIEDGKAKTVNKYKELQNLGYNCLYHSQRYDIALDCYEQCLNIKPEDFGSVIGLCLSKVSSSTFDNSHFDCVIEEFEKREIVLNIENTVLYLNFVSDLLNNITFYLSEADYRLLKDNVFINNKYFTYYLKTVNDIENTLKYLTDGFEILHEEEFNQYKEDFPTFIERVNEITKNIDERLNKTYQVNHIGDVLVENGVQQVLNTNVINFEEEELTDLNVVRENKKAKLYLKIFMPIVIFFGLLTLIMFIVFGVKKDPTFGYIAAGSLALSIITYFVYKQMLKLTYRK